MAITSISKVNILGSGIIASTVNDLINLDNNVEIFNFGFDNSTKRSIYSIRNYFHHDIIYNSSLIHGLSLHYHGVCPSKILKKRNGHSYPENFSSVVHSIPRSKIKSINFTRNYDIDLLCSGVINNLLFLDKVSEVNLRHVLVSDHLVIKVGKISYNEYSNLFPKKPFLDSVGFHFPHKDLDKYCRVFFRPSFNSHHTVNFGETAFGIGNFLLNNPVQKILSGINNRFGLFDFRQDRELYLQVFIPEFYYFQKSCLKVKISLADLVEIYRFYCDLCHSSFFSFSQFNFSLNNILPGIHLGYNRDVLTTDRIVLDTSLSDDPRDHPTILTCKKIESNYAQKSNFDFG